MVFTRKKLQPGVTSSMLPELQQTTVCIGATAIPPCPTATGTSATGVRRTEWNQTEEGDEKFPPPLNHQTQTRLQPLALRPPVHNPLSQTQTRLQPLRPPVHNPLSQTQTPPPGPPLTNRSHECLLNNIKACLTLLVLWKTPAEEPKPPKGKTIKKLAQTSQKRTNNEPSQKRETQQAKKSHCSCKPKKRRINKAAKIQTQTKNWLKYQPQTKIFLKRQTQKISISNAPNKGSGHGGY
eukprot:XP_014005928.1 PREDICTED: uncharacterized protein LOC106574523 isoform X2 [Salmo salar]